MPTFNNGESAASVRTKINDAIVKVDGVEAGADVTDTANVTAAGALMDSELANIAAVKALNQGVATTDSPVFVAVDVGSGSASAPSLSFSTDTDTGFYRAAANTLGITTGGTEAATFEDAGQTVFQLLSSGGDQLLNVDETTDDLLQVINADDTVLFQVSNTNGVMIGPAKTPASATATGITGQIAWDADYIYICTAINTWKRVAIATW
jgi:hypothetical protein